MVDSITIKPLGLVLIITAHMAFNRPSKAEVTGILGGNITLTFTFSDPHFAIDGKSHVAVYFAQERKIAECGQSSPCSRSGVLAVEPKNKTVLYRITNLTENNSAKYWAVVFVNTAKKSNEVWLNVHEENKSSTVLPTATHNAVTVNGGSSGSSSFVITAVLLVSPVVLLAAGLLLLIWCLVRTNDKQPPTQQNSNPTLRETIESNNASPPSVIYSILDFPKRPLTVLEMNPCDTEYAAVSYLTEKRTMHS